MTVATNRLPRLHIVEPNEAVQRALLKGLEKSGNPFSAGTISTQWLAMHHWDFEPSTVVVRAAIRDVWPVLVKVRALRALNCRPLVVLDCASYPAAHARLLAAGACAVVDTEAGVQALVEATGAALAEPSLPPKHLPQEPRPALADRSLQIAALFTSTFGPTSPQIAEALGIGPETVRTHVERVRSKYRSHMFSSGEFFDVSTRQGLRQALHEDGQIVGECGWYR